MRILVTGGGTGGHISPTLAVIEALEQKIKDPEILYLGSKEGIENIIIPKIGICFETISTGKIRRYHKNILFNIFDPFTIFKNINDIFKAIRGIFEARKKILNFNPDAIFLKGGYVSIPVGLAAKSLGYPFVLHESDTIPGLANRILAKYASVVCVSFPEEIFKGVFPKDTKIKYTGNPIRHEILEGDREEAFEKFNLNKKLKTILVIGGSQGSNRINRLIEGALEDILYKYQLIHITGDLDYDWIDFRASKLNNDLKNNYKYFNFLSGDLKHAYKAADLIISRAGCNVLTEIAANGKASILIPLSTSTGGHQFKNAMVFSREGASYVMDENIIGSRDILNQIHYLFDHKEELELLEKNIIKFYLKDAAFEIAEEILSNKIDRKKKDDKKGKGIKG